MTRSWYIGQALQSVASMSKVLIEMTAAEVTAALELECSTRRRSSIITRLISRAVRLNELEYSHTLKEKYGTPT